MEFRSVAEGLYNVVDSRYLRGIRERARLEHCKFAKYMKAKTKAKLFRFLGKRY